jgi:DNA-3-methyladenine glycosylase
MFGPPGRWYVYTIHRQWCLNLVTAPEGVGEAVLIRAVEPCEGMDLMMKRRGREALRDLCSGPGKLCQAFGIDKAFNGADAIAGPLRLEAGEVSSQTILSTTRIGLSHGKDLPYRFLVSGSPFLSKPPSFARSADRTTP